MRDIQTRQSFLNSRSPLSNSVGEPSKSNQINPSKEKWLCLWVHTVLHFSMRVLISGLTLSIRSTSWPLLFIIPPGMANTLGPSREVGLRGQTSKQLLANIEYCKSVKCSLLFSSIKKCIEDEWFWYKSALTDIKISTSIFYSTAMPSDLLCKY